MPLENEMKTPQAFGGLFGVLNQAIAIQIAMFVAVGLLGYLKYGYDAGSSITLNLPSDEG